MVCVIKHIPKPKVTKEKPSKPSTAKPPKPKPSKEKSTKATPLQKAGIGKVTKEQNVKSYFQLVDEPDEKPAQPEPEPEPEPEIEYKAQSQAHVGGVAIREPIAEATQLLPVVEGKGKEIATDEQDAQLLLALHTPKRRTNIVRDSPSLADAKTGADTDRTNSGGDTKILQIGDEQGGDVIEVVNLEDKTTEIKESQDGSDPGKTPESRPLPDNNKIDEDKAGSDPGESRVALAGPNPEPTHDEFMTNHKSKNLDNTTKNLGSRVFTLELRDLPHKIDETVRETVKEAVQVALQATLRDHFRDLPEADMKEMLHQRMFETGSYKSLPKHVALYEALEAYMERAQRDEFLAKKDKSRKRRRDDQDPPSPPPKDSDQSKKKRHNSDASGSKQPPAPLSSTWKTLDTREAPSSSSKQ
ncbi:hypothetical protein Tco_0681826 [Tanacetum coccineum]|uniref:Ubinuclein middle domain-containing protein n=1 Tax=Tanacetum coccineum TaxID=301880 RepID=A0ABQ4XPF5_9ASTR